MAPFTANNDKKYHQPAAGRRHSHCLLRALVLGQTKFRTDFALRSLAAELDVRRLQRPIPGQNSDCAKFCGASMEAQGPVLRWLCKLVFWPKQDPFSTG